MELFRKFEQASLFFHSIEQALYGWWDPKFMNTVDTYAGHVQSSELSYLFERIYTGNVMSVTTMKRRIAASSVKDNVAPIGRFERLFIKTMEEQPIPYICSLMQNIMNSDMDDDNDRANKDENPKRDRSKIEEYEFIQRYLQDSFKRPRLNPRFM